MTSKHPDSATGANEAIARWFDSQQQLWNNYLNLTADAGEPPWAGLYQQSRSASHQWLENALKMQTQWARQCIEMVAFDNGQSEAGRWASDLDTLVNEWADAERLLCEACLPSAPWRAPFVDSAKTAAAMGSVWRAWLDTGQTMVKMQSALASKMAAGPAKPSAKSRGAS